MRVEVGELRLDLTDEQAESLRRQLAVDCADDLLDAAHVARRLGVSREYVYAHARELGGEKLGSGERPRWRFDSAKVEAVLVVDDGRQPLPESSRRPDPGKRRRTRNGAKVELLEIRGKGPAEVERFESGGGT